MTYFRINPVLALLLLLTAIAAALPFISYAPNRLVSGEGASSLAAVAANDLDAGGRWLRLADGLFYSR